MPKGTELDYTLAQLRRISQHMIDADDLSAQRT